MCWLICMKITFEPQVPWWSQRTRMEKRFVVLVGSLGVVALSLGVGLVAVSRGQRNSIVSCASS